MPAAGTLIDVAAERRGSATHDRREDLQMQPGEPLVTVIEERRSGCADEVGHLDRRPRHLLGRA